MRHTTVRFMSIATIIATGLLVTPVFAAPVKASPQVLKVVTSSTLLRVNIDQFSMLVQIKNPATVKKTEILIDGVVVQTCKAGVSVCETVVGPFDSTTIGEHVFVFKLSGKNGTTGTQWGTFSVGNPNVTDPMTVIPAKVNLKTGVHNSKGVGVLEIFSSKLQFSVGEKGKRLLLMRGNANVESIYEYLDGSNDLANGNRGGTYSSGSLMGPFKDTDVGEHTILYEITGKNGEQMLTQFHYWVVPKGQTLAPPVADNP